ncbi:MAG TPA: GNAT family N-acetyltransferase [Bacillales bacterium]
MNIRKAKVEDSAGIAKVQVDSWKTTYDGIVPDSYLQRMSYEARKNNWKQIIDLSGHRNIVYVAEDEEGMVVGFVSGGRERSDNYPEFQSECYAIYLLEEVQAEGLGRKLFVRLAEDLSESGFSSMLVWVLADNLSARAFYESFSPETIDSQQIEIGGEMLEEVAYGWRTLKRFI